MFLGTSTQQITKREREKERVYLHTAGSKLKSLFGYINAP